MVRTGERRKRQPVVWISGGKGTDCGLPLRYVRSISPAVCMNR